MAGNRDRIEVSVTLTGSGASATPERIASLQRQQIEQSRPDKATAAAAFASVMRGKGGGSGKVPAKLSAKEEKQQALPKKGPKPGMVHPGLRDAFGRDEYDDGDVVVKG